MTTQADLWFDQLRAHSDRRSAALDRYRESLAWAKAQLDRECTSITAEEQATWEMINDIAVLVRTSIGAPREVYHLADQPCGHAFGRGFRPMLEGQAQARRLTRCTLCHWPEAQNLLASA